MTGDLFINNRDAWVYFGVNMNDSFIDTLTEPLTPKEYIENESRLEDGKRVIVDEEIKVSSRDLTLDFTMEGDTPKQLTERKTAFFTEMMKGNVKIKVPAVSDEVYNLIYKGKGTSYGMNPQRTFCHIMLKFDEPNPKNRAS